MRLLIYTNNGFAAQKSHIASFVLFDRRSLPVLLGVEYPLAEGIVRTFSDINDSDFLAVLSRSGVPTRLQGNDVPCVISTPFLGKGTSDVTTGVFQLLAINDNGKYLFATRKNEADRFETATYGDKNFDHFIQAYFSQ